MWRLIILTVSCMLCGGCAKAACTGMGNGTSGAVAVGVAVCGSALAVDGVYYGTQKVVQSMTGSEEEASAVKEEEAVKNKTAAEMTEEEKQAKMRSSQKAAIEAHKKKTGWSLWY